MKRYYKVHFERLAEMEPRLREMERLCQKWADESAGWESACANLLWFSCDAFRGGTLDRRLDALVGWCISARKKKEFPELATSEAYDTVFSYLYYSVLPDCRNCGCLSEKALLDHIMEGRQ